jgi:hypothetical protein
MGEKLVFLGLFIVFGGALAAAFSFSAYRSDLALKGWPAVQGTLLSSKLAQTTEARRRQPNRNGAPQPALDVDLVPVWAMDVEYGYTVDAVGYQGTRATSRHWVEDLSTHPAPSPQLQGLAAALNTGAATLIHYDPANPAQSYIKYERSPETMSNFRLGVVLAVIGLGVAAIGKLVV